MNELYQQTVATYKINNVSYDVVEIGENKRLDGYDVFDNETGECLNLGDIFFEFPSRTDIKNYIEKPDE